MRVQQVLFPKRRHRRIHLFEPHRLQIGRLGAVIDAQYFDILNELRRLTDMMGVLSIGVADSSTAVMWEEPEAPRKTVPYHK